VNAPCSLLIILVTCVVSWFGFRSRIFEEKYIFNPEAILAGKDYHRLVTSGFLHAGWSHLLMNMLSLYFFGPPLEYWLGKAQLLLIYFGAIIGGNLLSLYIHRHHDYRAYGASGGVCGVIFAFILLSPHSSIYLYYALPIPGWLYAIGFLLVSTCALRAGRDNIGHDAHLGGAIVGLLITAALNPQALRYNWVVFLLMFLPALGVLMYLWMAPLFLPLAGILKSRPGTTRRRFSLPRMPSQRREEKQIDAILEKVSREGIHSLTAAEKAFLEEVSEKYRRRAESEKPKSDLII
jgi:membrane associated rhomboid family serine protease